MIEKQYRVLGMRALFRLITRFICAVWDAQCNTEESHKVMIKIKESYNNMQCKNKRTWFYSSTVEEPISEEKKKKTIGKNLAIW